MASNNKAGRLVSERTKPVGYFPSSGPYTGIPTPLKTAIDWWQTIIKETTMPTRQSVGFKELLGWHTRMTLCEVDHASLDLFALIVGEDVAEVFGGAVGKGSSLREVIKAPVESHVAHITKIVKEKQIAVTEGAFTRKDGTPLQASCIDFPIYDNQQEQISFILSLYDIRPNWAENVIPTVAVAE